MSPTTFQDLLDMLKKEDEISLLEILNLSSSELVDMLQDTIEDQQDRLFSYYEEDEDQDQEEESY